MSTAVRPEVPTSEQTDAARVRTRAPDVPEYPRAAAVEPPEQFRVEFANDRVKRQALEGDLYSTALAYVRGEIDVAGDLFAAIRFFLTRPRRGWRQAWHLLLARCGAWRVEATWQSRRRAVRNVQRHYDLSNDFYRQFLDRGMTYSCAYFQQPDWEIETAQEAKLRHILTKLDLHSGERFLDIGCGWGSLVERAARDGASATGCTLSRAQYELARERLAGFGRRVTVLEADYRDLAGPFDKIASVGMFEHVGRRRLHMYFRKVYDLLDERGLFLNHGLVRPQNLEEGAETLFLRRMVFPGTELPHQAEVLRTAEEAGFEVLDVENLRPHYALTCRAWVRRLLENREACVSHVGPETHRTWVLYLAACAVQFEMGRVCVCQTLLAKRSSPLPRRLSRDYMYGGASTEYNIPAGSS